jgi:hypothetical protein
MGIQLSGRVLVWLGVCVLILGGVGFWVLARQAPQKAFLEQCKTEVLKGLKSPGSAQFQTDAATPTQLGRASFIWDSYVDSQNSFGALMRDKFTCTYISLEKKITMAWR